MGEDIEHEEPEAMFSYSQLDSLRAAYMHCAVCNSPRLGSRCQKCGTKTHVPDPRWDWPRMPPLDLIRNAAKEVGYAIGVHGTMERDVDLIAAPWSATAVSPEDLIDHLCKAVGGRVVGGFEHKPLGRYSVNISMSGWYKLIDLSICPRTLTQSLEQEHL